jgi:hypothetical protein
VAAVAEGEIALVCDPIGVEDAQMRGVDDDAVAGAARQRETGISLRWVPGRNSIAAALRSNTSSSDRPLIWSAVMPSTLVS